MSQFVDPVASLFSLSTRTLQTPRFPKLSSSPTLVHLLLLAIHPSHANWYQHWHCGTVSALQLAHLDGLFEDMISLRRQPMQFLSGDKAPR
ncbi:hypothetical protein HHK36_018558 [Tetracentron sinense]|uniref:Uncharacterized protein n=1 Tax=Tetracentron sinense TaxID=13715 RepID=A0A834Z2F6_TETSI|nr:hypothetical protein HHK36_018558 [Tetracentron sinense]